MSKWGKLVPVARIAAAIVGTIVPGVAKVEQMTELIVKAKGKEKQDAVVGLVKAALETSEGITERDLLNDPHAEAATRAVIDAVVHLHNVVARKVVPASATAAQLGVHAGSLGD